MLEYPNIEPAQNDAIRDLLRDMEDHSIGEAGHAERVAVFSVAVGERLGMSMEQLIRLRQAAALHDVGKINVDRALLKKIGELSTEELSELRLHALRAKKVIESLTWLAPALPMIVHHHEHWNGTGYPDGLAGEAIPLGARIIAVAEAFDALTNGAGWRNTIPEEEAIEEIKRCSGTQFDPTVVDEFLEIQPLIQPMI